MVFLGNSPISWAIKKHRGFRLDLLSTESEIVQVVEACKELLWLQPLLLDLGYLDIDWMTSWPHLIQTRNKNWTRSSGEYKHNSW